MWSRRIRQKKGGFSGHHISEFGRRFFADPGSVEETPHRRCRGLLRACSVMVLNQGSFCAPAGGSSAVLHTRLKSLSVSFRSTYICTQRGPGRCTPFST